MVSKYILQRTSIKNDAITTALNEIRSPRRVKSVFVFDNLQDCIDEAKLIMRFFPQRLYVFKAVYKMIENGFSYQSYQGVDVKFLFSIDEK